jgi:release factor glutamine methyltransferase
VNARDAARKTAAKLERAGVPDASFEGELLVRLAAGLDRAAYFQDPKLSCDAALLLRNSTRERVARKPYAYIAETREFYGREFLVSPDVLIPRPETELLVDLACASVDRCGATRMVDVGTGSGCIAVTLSKERPGVDIVATDVSEAAIAVARENSVRHEAGVQFIRTDLVACLTQADIVIANLPYIPDDDVEQLEPEVREWEPRLALAGGPDGLMLIRRLIHDCAARLRPSALLLEIEYRQADAVTEIASHTGASVQLHSDLAGIQRFAELTWR